MDDSLSRDEILESLRQCQLFASLPDETLDQIVKKCTCQTYGPGSVVFDVEDPSDTVYIIKSGVVEISRTNPTTQESQIVAYLGEREAIGEMAILTGSPRGSVARVPEKAELLAISRKGFLGLLGKTPGLTVRLATILAKRLEAWIRKERLQIKGQELSGNLEYFDASTLIQTLAQSDRTGLLTIIDQNDHTVGKIYIEQGEVRYARLGHLKGIEAFYQVFQSVSGKAFTFKVGEFEAMPKENRIPFRTIALLFEANRLRDELNKLKEDIPNTNKVYLPKGKKLSWKDRETEPLAKEIWQLIHQGRSLSFILEKAPASHYSVYRILSQMLEQEQIGP
jgi:CRP-like cAMP-binding protein